jgi:hypothetical protein
MKLMAGLRRLSRKIAMHSSVDGFIPEDRLFRWLIKTPPLKALGS